MESASTSEQADEDKPDRVHTGLEGTTKTLVTYGFWDLKWAVNGSDRQFAEDCVWQINKLDEGGFKTYEKYFSSYTWISILSYKSCGKGREGDFAAFLEGR